VQQEWENVRCGKENCNTSCLSSVISVRRLRKKWDLLSTRQQKHTMESIYDQVRVIREQFPLRGAEAIRKSLRVTHGVRVPR
jgi:hypothetical protein